MAFGPSAQRGAAAPTAAADIVRGRSGPLAALEFRNFRLFVIGQLISLAGTWMQQVALQWLIFSLTHSAAWLGFVTGATALPAVLLSLPAGQLADRVPRRTILIVTQAAALLLATALALLATNWWIPIAPWHLIVFAVLGGIVNAFNLPAQQAFVPEMIDDRKALGNAIALNSILFNTARFLGPILAGIVLVRFGSAACFGANAASYIAVLISLALIRLPHRERPQSGESIWAGFRFIGQIPSVLRTISLVGVSSFLIWSIATLFPILADRFHAGATGYTLIMASNGVGAALGGIIVATFGERIPRRALVYGGPIIFCAAFFALSVCSTFPLALLCLFLAGFGMIVFGVSAQTKIQSDVTDALRGRVMAVYSLVFSGLLPLGGLAIGAVAQKIETLPAIRINAALCLVITAALFAWSQRDPHRNDIAR